MDGCAKWRTFLKIVLPVSVPSILTASLLAFIFSWNNFMFSLTLSGAKTTTLPIAIYGFVGYAAVYWGGLMAAAVFIVRAEIHHLRPHRRGGEGIDAIYIGVWTMLIGQLLPDPFP